MTALCVHSPTEDNPTQQTDTVNQEGNTQEADHKRQAQAKRKLTTNDPPTKEVKRNRVKKPATNIECKPVAETKRTVEEGAYNSSLCLCTRFSLNACFMCTNSAAAMVLYAVFALHVVVPISPFLRAKSSAELAHHLLMPGIQISAAERVSTLTARRCASQLCIRARRGARPEGI